MGKSRKVLYTADFETVNKIDDCRVWATALYNIENDNLDLMTNNIDSFMKYLEKKSKKESMVIYFHNLKFDGEFILAYLLQRGFRYNEMLSEPCTYRTIITDSGQYYQIEIVFWSKGNCKIVKIQDSLKIIPLKIKQMSKAFGLSHLKGEIDYNAERKEGHKLTDEEKAYLLEDVRIASQSLKFMFSHGIDKMTISSSALNHFKNITFKNKKDFRRYFPKLDFPHSDDMSIDDFIRKSYKGGYTYTSPNYQGKAINKNGMTFDVNSLYPSQMYNNLLPYGIPMYFKGMYEEDKNFPLYIQKIRCKFKLKKGFTPTIQLKNNARFGSTVYIKDSGVEPVDLYLTNIDLEIFEKHYNIYEADFIEGYKFHAKRGFFKKYIDYWIDIKNKATRDKNKGLRTIAKLMLNSLYGKFATNTKTDMKIPNLENEIVKLKLKESLLDDDDYTFKDSEPREMIYTAMACFITAYARKVTITAIMNVGGNKKRSRFCYADTDSIHIVGEDLPSNIEIDNVKLGAWKHESNWKYAKFIRAKTYMEEVLIKDNEECLDFINYDSVYLDVKCCGMPDNVKTLVTKQNFKIGYSVLAIDKTIDDKYKKLMPKKVKNGVVLLPTDFTIN